MYPARQPGLRARLMCLPGGERVRVVECGPADGPPLLFIPGWACSAYSYRYLLPDAAAAGFRCHAVDLRGHGLSDKPEDERRYSLEAMTAHVLEILDALALERAAVVAQSMGAAIAASVAMAAPQRVERLVLVGPVGFGRVRGARLGAILSPRWLLPVLPHLFQRWLLRAVLGLAMGSRGRYDTRAVEEYWAPSQYPSFAVALRHLLHHFRWTAFAPAERARIRAPTLLIFGTRDRFVSPPPRLASRPGDSVHATTLGAARVAIIEGAGHAAQEEVPATVNALALEFLLESPHIAARASRPHPQPETFP